MALLNIRSSWFGRYPPLYLKKEWSGEGNSPYYFTFKGFIEDLESILYKNCEINNIKDISKILGFSGRHTIGEILSSLQVGHQFKVSEESLDKWYARLYAYFGSSPTTSQAIADIDELFDIMYRKFGYKAYHPLYRSAKLALSSIGDVLADAGAIESNTLNNILKGLENVKDLEGFKGDNLPEIRRIYYSLVENPQRFPDVSKEGELMVWLNNLLVLVETGKKFASEHAVQIEHIMKGYIGIAEQYIASVGFINQHYIHDSYRKALIVNIISKCPSLQAITDLAALSTLLFGREDGLTQFLKKGSESSRPYLHTVFNLVLQSQYWTEEIFLGLGIEVSRYQISRMRYTIREELREWVFSVPSFEENWAPYLTQARDMSNEYQLSLAFWLAAVVHEDNFDLTFANLRDSKLYKVAHSFRNNLVAGRSFSANTMRNILSVIKQWIKQESEMDPNSNKLKIYFSAQAQISYYSLINRLKIMKQPGGERLTSGGLRFVGEYTVAYHVLTGLGKHLGFDPLTFSIIDERSFNLKNEEKSLLSNIGIRVYRFLRHHYRDLIGRDSFFHGDTVITDNSAHILWESLTEAESLTILKGFETLIAMKGSGNSITGIANLNEITEIDIESVFKGNEWVYAGWYSTDSFEENLHEFNHRRRDIRLMGLEKFISEYNKIAYNRFYKNILIKSRDSLQKLLAEIHPIPQDHNLRQFLDIDRIIKAEGNNAYLEEIMRYLTNLIHIYGSPIPLI